MENIFIVASKLDAKRPIRRGWQENAVSLDEVKEAIAKGYNAGIEVAHVNAYVASGVIVLDLDVSTPEEAEAALHLATKLGKAGALVLLTPGKERGMNGYHIFIRSGQIPQREMRNHKTPIFFDERMVMAEVYHSAFGARYIAMPFYGTSREKEGGRLLWAKGQAMPSNMPLTPELLIDYLTSIPYRTTEEWGITYGEQKPENMTGRWRELLGKDWAIATPEDIQKAMLNATPGTRNNTLYYLAQIVGAREKVYTEAQHSITHRAVFSQINPDKEQGLLIQAAIDTGLPEKEVMATFKSGWRWGNIQSKLSKSIQQIVRAYKETRLKFREAIRELAIQECYWYEQNGEEYILHNGYAIPKRDFVKYIHKEQKNNPKLAKIVEAAGSDLKNYTDYMVRAIGEMAYLNASPMTSPVLIIRSHLPLHIKDTGTEITYAGIRIEGESEPHILIITPDGMEVKKVGEVPGIYLNHSANYRLVKREWLTTEGIEENFAVLKKMLFDFAYARSAMFNEMGKEGFPAFVAMLAPILASRSYGIIDISGTSGSGKTTLAEILSYITIGEAYMLGSTTQDILTAANMGFAILDENNKPRNRMIEQLIKSISNESMSHIAIRKLYSNNEYIHFKPHFTIAMTSVHTKRFSTYDTYKRVIPIQLEPSSKSPLYSFSEIMAYVKANHARAWLASLILTHADPTINLPEWVLADKSSKDTPYYYLACIRMGLSDDETKKYWDTIWQYRAESMTGPWQNLIRAFRSDKSLVHRMRHQGMSAREIAAFLFPDDPHQQKQFIYTYTQPSQIYELRQALKVLHLELIEERHKDNKIYKIRAIEKPQQPETPEPKAEAPAITMNFFATRNRKPQPISNPALHPLAQLLLSQT